MKAAWAVLVWRYRYSRCCWLGVAADMMVRFRLVRGRGRGGHFCGLAVCAVCHEGPAGSAYESSPSWRENLP